GTGGTLIVVWRSDRCAVKQVSKPARCELPERGFLAQRAGGGWGERAKILHRVGEDVEHPVDLGFGSCLEQAKAEAGAGMSLVEAHGHEDMAGLSRAGVTGRSGGDSDAFQIERDDE